LPVTVAYQEVTSLRELALQGSEPTVLIEFKRSDMLRDDEDLRTSSFFGNSNGPAKNRTTVSETT
jgi:hypothetical protein